MQHTISHVLDMTIKEETFVVNRKLPSLHVSAYNLAGCIARLSALTPTGSEVLFNLFNMLVLTGPPKVEGVRFWKNVVKNGRIHQEVQWNVPVLRHNAKPQYIIRYADKVARCFLTAKLTTIQNQTSHFSSLLVHQTYHTTL